MPELPLQHTKPVLPPLLKKFQPSLSKFYRFLLFQQPKGKIPNLPNGAYFKHFEASDATRCLAIHFPAPKNAPTIVHFHGTGVHLGDIVHVGESLRKQGLGVLLVEYRGYGCLSGTPTEEGLYLDALAALDALEKEGVHRNQIILLGISLGSAVAAEMAVRQRGSRLILITPFTSIPDIAKHHVKFFPEKSITKERFDNLTKTPLINIPTLVIHGTQDKVVPFNMGHKVATSLKHIHFVTIKNGGHCNLFEKHSHQVLNAIVKHALGHQ